MVHHIEEGPGLSDLLHSVDVLEAEVFRNFLHVPLAHHQHPHVVPVSEALEGARRENHLLWLKLHTGKASGIWYFNAWRGMIRRL